MALGNLSVSIGKLLKWLHTTAVLFDQIELIALKALYYALSSSPNFPRLIGQFKLIAGTAIQALFKKAYLKIFDLQEHGVILIRVTTEKNGKSIETYYLIYRDVIIAEAATETQMQRAIAPFFGKNDKVLLGVLEGYTNKFDQAFLKIASLQNLRKLKGVSVKQIDNISLNQLKLIKSTNGIDEFANIAVAEVNLNVTLNKRDFVAQSGFDNFKSKIPNGSACPNQNTKIFTTKDAPTSSGQMRLRQNDAEVKIFEDIAFQLGAKQGDVGSKVFDHVSGEIVLKTELSPCGSCSGVIEQFNEMFPHVNITVLAQPKISF